ncbi:hypothetical protein QJQ45_005047 [Haematococcus lacustris]|nr:hypothetical protein QJQ45_005047 [Haematococcus lacustris]
MARSSWVALGVVAVPTVLIGGSVVIQMCSIMYSRWRLRKIPGPPPHLLLGNILDIIKAGGSHLAVHNWRKTYGNIFKIYFGRVAVIVVGDPDLARQVLYRFTNHMEFLAPGLAFMHAQHKALDQLGLVQARDGYWRSVRNAWQPAFAPGSIQRYAALMTRCADHLCELLEEAAVEGQVVDIHDALNKMTLGVVGECAYGVDFETLQKGELSAPEAQGRLLNNQNPTSGAGRKLVDACKAFFSNASFSTGSKWAMVAAVLPSLTPFLKLGAWLLPDEPLTKQRKARETLITTSQSLIAAWRQQHPAPPPPHPQAHLAASADTANGAATKANGGLTKALTGSAEQQLGSQAAKGATNGKAAQGKRQGGEEQEQQGEGEGEGGGLSAVKPAGSLAGVAPGSFLALLLSAQERVQAALSTNAYGTAAVAAAVAGGKVVVHASGKAAAAAAGGGERGQEGGGVLAAPGPEANTFILAGTETTANTLTYCLYFLAQNPAILQALQEEVDAFGPPGTPITAEDQFPWADAIVAESQRLLPAAHSTTRDMEGKPEGLQLGPYLLPNNAKILIPIYRKLVVLVGGALQTFQVDEAQWPRAMEFLPQRFMEKGKAELGPRNPNSFLPFGGGTRHCPGYKFAILEARIALVTLFQRFTFSLEPGQVPIDTRAGITLTPAKGLRVKVHARPPCQAAHTC